MEQKIRFELVLGRLAILAMVKIIGADYEELLRAVFLSFQRHFFYFDFFCSK